MPRRQLRSPRHFSGNGPVRTLDHLVSVALVRGGCQKRSLFVSEIVVSVKPLIYHIHNNGTTYFTPRGCLFVNAVFSFFYSFGNRRVVALKFFVYEGLGKGDPFQGPIQFPEIRELVAWM
jgi:hypothetical protein